MDLRTKIKARMNVKDTGIVDTLSNDELRFVEEHMIKMSKASGHYEIKLVRDKKDETLNINLNYGSTYIKK